MRGLSGRPATPELPASRSLWLVLRAAPGSARTVAQGLPPWPPPALRRPCSEHPAHGHEFPVGEAVRSPLLGCLHGGGGGEASGVAPMSLCATAFPRGTGDTWRALEEENTRLYLSLRNWRDQRHTGDIGSVAGRKSRSRPRPPRAGGTPTRGLTVASRLRVPARPRETPGRA